MNIRTRRTGGLVSTHSKAIVSALAIAIAIVSALAVVNFPRKQESSTEILFRNGRTFTDPAISNAGQLANPSSGLRAPSAGNAPAGQLVGPRPATISSELVQKLGFALMAEPKADVREGIASNFGKLASQQNSGSVEPGPREAQMLDLLQAAYSQERDVRVRSAIVRSAAAFNHPSAASLMDMALADPDESVRKAASEAKRIRSERLVLSDRDGLRPTIWR